MSLIGSIAVDLGTLVIAASGTASSIMDLTGWRGSVAGISIAGPGTLTGSVKVQVASVEGEWKDKQSGGADIAIPADGHVTIKAMDFKYLRVLSDGAEASERTFVVVGLGGWG